jgi:hypothetical protein
LNRRVPRDALGIDSVMNRFARQGTPVIHLVYIDTLAEKYGIPKSPSVMPHIGEARVFAVTKYNVFLAAANLIILVFVLYIFLRLDIGYRIFGTTKATETPKHPEPMV